MAKTDVTGIRFGKLVAIAPAERLHNHVAWLFRCDCGTEKVIRLSHVTTGRVIACGHRRGNSTHGMAHTRLWQVWKSMKQRCDNPNVTAYHRYGGRGISYTPEWATFEPFRDWALAHGYAADLELDRIDNDGNYHPGNCQFLGHKANSQKTSVTRTVEFEGKVVPICQLAERLGLEQNTVFSRIRRGWPVDRVFAPVVHARKKEMSP